MAGDVETVWQSYIDSLDRTDGAEHSLLGDLERAFRAGWDAGVDHARGRFPRAGATVVSWPSVVREFIDEHPGADVRFRNPVPSIQRLRTVLDDGTLVCTAEAGDGIILHNPVQNITIELWEKA